jgi:L-threonylcarbamoyladenylate synthase
MTSDLTIPRAAEILRSGGIVAFPTETVYGLGANALDERAVARVFEVKGRPRFDPLIVHIADIDWIGRLADRFPSQARKLADRFWPGPLTLVLPKTPAVPDLVTAGGPTVALRIPRHPVAEALLRAADVPIAAPSANPFGRVSPTIAAHVREQLGDAVDLIVDGGPCCIGIESTVVEVTEDHVVLHRFGGTTLEEIEGVVGEVTVARPRQSLSEKAGLVAPGTLTQHYAPRTPLVLRTREMASAGESLAPGRAPVGLLAFRQRDDSASFAHVEILSPSGDLREAAANFFAALRRLDAAGLALIVAETFPETGLGRALNDRLRRAAHS